MNDKIRNIFLLLLVVLSLLMSGCYIKDGKDEAWSEEESSSADSSTELDKISEKIDSMEKIIESCICAHTYTKTENEEWIIYECEPMEGSLYELDGPSLIKLNKLFDAELYSYEEAKVVMEEWLDYHLMWHFHNLENEYGITDIYEAVSGEDGPADKSCYLIYCGNDSYLIKIEGKMGLSTALFSNLSYSKDFSEKHQKQMIECGDNKESIINSNFYSKDNTVIYEICHGGKEAPSILMELLIEQNSYTLQIKQNQKDIQSLAWESDGITVYPQFIDANRDGYVDILLITKQGIANNEKDLYIWNRKSNYYDKVTYSGDNFISNIEVKENCIWNWLDNGVEGHTLEILEWNGNKLIPVSVEVTLNS